MAGGPYAVDIAAGSLVGRNGYALAFDNAGRVTVSPKALTGTVTAYDKTYDGSTAGDGRIDLAGVLDGDAVEATARFDFADRHAGAGKVVHVSEAGLSGADAANYTIEVPASAAADIFRRAITVTADPAAKDEGQADPGFTYALTQGSLVAGDELIGALTRVAGEAPGVYDILQGSLKATDDYVVTYVGSQLTIRPATHDDLGVLGAVATATPQAASPSSELQVADQRETCEAGSMGCE